MNGEHDITVTLFADDSTSTSLWEDTFTSTLENGYVSLDLGSQLSLAQGDFAGAEMWAEIHLGVGGTMIGARQRLRAVPFAQVAAGVAVVALTPESPDCVGQAGAIHYNLESESLLVCDGTTWQQVSSQTVVGTGIHNTLVFWVQPGLRQP